MIHKTKKLAFTPKKTDEVIFDFTTEELEAGLGDVRWRLNNLYCIINKRKEVVVYRENEAQKYLYDGMHTRNVILKCRKLGFSTAIQLLMLDTALFSPNETGRVIAQDLGIAEAIFRDVFKFAYDRLPDPFKTSLPTASDPSKTVMEFRNDSRVEVSSNARGTTPTFLHISEFGKIAAKDPGKAREIITGSITSVAEDGLIFVESTAEGQQGEFYEMVQNAIATSEMGVSLWKLQFKFFFFAWFQNPDYKAPVSAVTLSSEDEEYFEEIEAETKYRLSPEQKAWYTLFLRETYSGDRSNMWSEQPSTPSEAFKISTESGYFKNELKNARSQRRRGLGPHDPHYPVSTFWDIGANDETAIWFIQAKRTHFSVINFIEATGEPFAYFVGLMAEMPYTYGYHYLPHDANHRKQGALRNLTPEEMLRELMPYWKFDLVPRTPDKQMAIQQTREVFHLCVFDEKNCALGLKHLQNFLKDWDPRTGTWRNIPKKNASRNAADAFLQFGQARAQGLFGEVSSSVLPNEVNLFGRAGGIDIAPLGF